MRWVIPSLPFGMLMSIGLFVSQLDGSPVYAMLCNSVPDILYVVGCTYIGSIDADVYHRVLLENKAA